MNKIKNSFSKIKASDEFKDKLEKRLLSESVNLKSNTKKIYYIPSIKAAAVLLLLVGAVSFKLATSSVNKDNTNAGSIAYSPNNDAENNNITKSENDDIKTYAFDDKPQSDAKNNEVLNNDVSNNNNNNNNNISTKSTTNVTTSQDNENKEYSITKEQPIKNSTNNNINPNSVSTIENANSSIPKEINNTKQSALSSIDNDKSDANNEFASLFSTMQDNTVVDSVYIPKIEIPTIHNGIATKMIPLIVYNGNVYTRASIEIDSKDVKNFLGRKIGTTKNNINELSPQSNYSVNLASNIGNTEVYSVNGYDEDFRIMTNTTLEDGTSYPEIYECLNGISIKIGQDFFGKFKLQGNISSAKFQTFTDWNNGTGNSYSINDLDLLNSFIENLNYSIPYLPKDVEPLLGDYNNDNDCKQIYLNLKDGSKNIPFTILKSGYVYYGEHPNIYFKIDTQLVKEIWDKLGVMSVN